MGQTIDFNVSLKWHLTFSSKIILCINEKVIVKKYNSQMGIHMGIQFFMELEISYWFNWFNPL